MRRLLKPLRVLLALGCFLCVNAAFLMPAVRAAFCLDEAPDFTWATRMQFLPALLALNLVAVGTILVVTALVGRVYCSTVCPFGVLQDIAIRLRRLVGGGRGVPPLPTRLRTRLILLAVLGLLGVFGGLVAVAALDPYSAYGRISTNLIRPAFQQVLNWGAAWSDAHEKYWLMSDEVMGPAAFALIVSALTLAIIAALAVWKGRWFCNRLCPVGACLALASHRPLVRLKIDATRCVSCGLCAKACKAGAIDAQTKTIDNAQCVRCFNCLGVCKKGAIRL